MGNSPAIPEKTVEALNFLNLTDSDFSRADKDHDGALDAAELLKLLRFKENTLRRHANALGAITKDVCEKIVKLADKNEDHKIDIGEFHFAMGKLENNVFVRREAQRLAMKMMDDEKKRRINAKKPTSKRCMSMEAKQFHRAMMFKHSNLGVKGSHDAARKENQRRAGAAAEKERQRLLQQFGRKPRGRHQSAKMIQKNRMKKHEIGISKRQARGLSEADIRVKNQEKVAAAVKKEQQELAGNSRVVKHFRHKTAEALHEAWMKNTGLSAAERAKVGSTEKVRTIHQARAIKAMEAQRKTYMHERAVDAATEKNVRHNNQQKAKIAMERERARRVLERKQLRTQAQCTRKVRQQHAANSADHEQARRVHVKNQTVAHADMKRQQNQKKAAAASDHEQSRRMHETAKDQVHADMARKLNQKKAAGMRDHEQARLVHEVRKVQTHNSMVRSMNQKKASDMRDHEQARLVHKVTKNNIHADMTRKLNQQKAAAILTHEQARLVHEWKRLDVHNNMARAQKQKVAVDARSKEAARISGAEKTSVKSIKKDQGEHPHAKVMKKHKKTRHHHKKRGKRKH